MLYDGREQRRTRRTRRRNAAFIRFADGCTRLPCVLWDISETGARLAAPRAKALPAAFHLLLANDDSSQRPCRVVWRNDKQLGVKFIEATAEDLEEEALRGQLASHDLPSTNCAEAASFLLPGYGPHFLDKPARRGIPISFFAAGMLFLLMASTTLFLLAGMHSAVDAPWALQVCDVAGNFCRYPEWTGVAGALMAVVYLAVRGMEI